MTVQGKEYGEALYELARDEGLAERIHGELLEIRDLIQAQPEFGRLLSSRAIERDERLSVVERTFDGQAQPYVVNFMKLLVERERFDAFRDAVQHYHERYNEDNHIVEAHVTTAVPLTQEEREALLARLELMTGQRVSLLARVDESVVGGVRVEMNGKRYDNTIESRMSALRRTLATGLRK